MMLQPLQRGALVSVYRSSCYRRAFFSLPKVSPNSSETQAYHERKILPYRPSDLYQIVADVESYPNFLPVFNRSEREDGVILMDAELTIAFLTFRESYVSSVTCKPCESVQAVASSSTLFKTLNSVWRFQPASPNSPHPSEAPLSRTAGTTSDDGPTLVTLDIEYAFSNPMHAAVSAKVFGQVSQLLVKSFEARCLAVYGPGWR
ncbi:dehydrase and lipid transport-domain-containing protein [Pisolithus marmoratus]|nr:dehydrase and lipid transport-domain-containing protein [Pisolithus marmoratus]